MTLPGFKEISIKMSSTIPGIYIGGDSFHRLTFFATLCFMYNGKQVFTAFLRQLALKFKVWDKLYIIIRELKY